MIYSLFVLAVGIVIVLGLIIGFRVNAFIALIVAALAVSLLAAPPPAEVQDSVNQVNRVAFAFGESAGKIGVVIALAAVIGQCMMESGAADRVVRFFLSLFGQRRASIALMGSGYVLAIPVFFDTVFYLLVPLARSLYRKTGKNYLMYIMAIAAGGAVTHTLVPPTPGPLAMASNLGIDLGMMILVGALVALPAAIVGIVFSMFIDRWLDIPMRPIAGKAEPEPLPDSQLPWLGLAILPVVLPVLMISCDTVVSTLAKLEQQQAAAAVANAASAGGENATAAAPPEAGPWTRARRVTALIGDANLAMLVSATIAILMYFYQRRPTLVQFAEMAETSLMSAGVIILITAAGGAFGAMLKVAGIGDAVKGLFEGYAGTGGLFFLFLGFGVAALLKVAQGSSTVAMLTGSAMLAPMIASPDTLGFHPVYLATAIGSGSLIGSWMNDSGFWIFAKMGGITDVEALKSWTLLLIVLGVTGMAATVLLSLILPLSGAA
jgi:GntP family gluconate:H+ symporter